MKSLPKPSWQDRVRQVNEYHKSMLRENEGWRIEDTSDSLNRAKGSVCEDLILTDWMRVYPKIELFKTAREALKFIRSKKKEMRLK